MMPGQSWEPLISLLRQIRNAIGTIAMCWRAPATWTQIRSLLISSGKFWSQSTPWSQSEIRTNLRCKRRRGALRTTGMTTMLKFWKLSMQRSRAALILITVSNSSWLRSKSWVAQTWHWSVWLSVTLSVKPKTAKMPKSLPRLQPSLTMWLLLAPSENNSWRTCDASFHLWWPTTVQTPRSRASFQAYVIMASSLASSARTQFGFTTTATALTKFLWARSLKTSLLRKFRPVLGAKVRAYRALFTKVLPMSVRRSKSPFRLAWLMSDSSSCSNACLKIGVSRSNEEAYLC